jgi:hypothetical protein
MAHGQHWVMSAVTNCSILLDEHREGGSEKGEGERSYVGRWWSSHSLMKIKAPEWFACFHERHNELIMVPFLGWHSTENDKCVFIVTLPSYHRGHKT